MSLYKDFDSIYKKVFRTVDASRLPKKYLDTNLLYNRFFNRLKDIKESGLTTGIDFGCGVGGTSVLGRLMGLEIYGLDIPYVVYAEGSDNYVRKEGINPLSLVQNELKKIGYNMVVRDTSVYPWDEFVDDQFEFLLSFNSLDDDYSSNSEKDHISFKRKNMINRMNEILRITKKDSLWMVGTTRKYKGLVNSEFYKNNVKNTDIDVRLWRR